MGVSVAEYLGQRTDVDEPRIEPALPGSPCPFMDARCSKVNKGNPPVCSVRKMDGNIWIVCEHRLCATKRNMSLVTHQQNILRSIAQTVFQRPLDFTDICVKREQPLQVTERNHYKADYIMTTTLGHHQNAGPDRVVLEMQGGGETSSTGHITRLILAWENNQDRTNRQLRQQTGAGTIETNAWRRQQEQFIVKGNIAMKTWKGLGIVFCVGLPLYDYLNNRLSNAYLPDLRNHNWTLCMLGIKENTAAPVEAGPLDLIIDEERQLFTNYQTFVQALINQGDPSPDAFAGSFINLQNERVDVPWN